MAVFRFTSLANSLVGLIIVAINGVIFFSTLWASLELLEIFGSQNWPTPIAMGVFLICFIASIWAMVVTQLYLGAKFLHPLSAYLYARISLRTRLSWTEAREIYILFVPNTTGKWFPMTHIRSLPTPERHSALISQSRDLIRRTFQ